ncbi:MAG: hypothetical protein GOMPHAMPRED_003809 [Gomphillus americanus]|uniref:Uncharacterized protein n=1 Tax=Gomphillus americanus TaxID=1940652 RepID=A0A8H3FNK8_9LECA|nr:MAG: hypothetical protein GOMPHAMPRED_003809 [Gomphillus americanus]
MSGRNRKYDLEPLREAISQRKQARQPVSEILRWLRGEGINIKRTQLYAIMTEWQIVPPRPSSEDIPGFDILLQDLIYRKGLSDYEISIAMSEEFGCTYKPVTIRNLRLQRGLLRRNISQRREELTEQWRAIVEAEFRRGSILQCNLDSAISMSWFVRSIRMERIDVGDRKEGKSLQRYGDENVMLIRNIKRKYGPLGGPNGVDTSLRDYLLKHAYSNAGEPLAVIGTADDLYDHMDIKKEPEIKQETLEEKRKDIHQDIQPIVVHSAEVTFRQPFEDLIEADPRQTTPVASDEVDGLSEGIRAASMSPVATRVTRKGARKNYRV